MNERQFISSFDRIYFWLESLSLATRVASLAHGYDQRHDLLYSDDHRLRLICSMFQRIDPGRKKRLPLSPNKAASVYDETVNNYADHKSFTWSRTSLFRTESFSFWSDQFSKLIIWSFEAGKIVIFWDWDQSSQFIISYLVGLGSCPSPLLSAPLYLVSHHDPDLLLSHPAESTFLDDGPILYPEYLSVQSLFPAIIQGQ